jgi:hypothetical protein
MTEEGTAAGAGVLVVRLVVAAVLEAVPLRAKSSTEYVVEAERPVRSTLVVVEVKGREVVLPAGVSLRE